MSDIDVNEPVENPNLSKAIDALARDPSEHNKTILLDELNKANYLAAIIPDEMKTTEPDVDGNMVIKKNSLIKIISASDDQGNTFFPLFTDWKEIQSYIKTPVNSWILPAKDAWYMAIKGQEYHGVVINPGGNTLPLSMEQVQYLHEQIK